MNKELTKKEIKEVLRKVVLTKKPGEQFSAHNIIKDYFSSISLGEWEDMRRKYWSRVKVDMSEVKRELEEEGKIVFVKENKREGRINEKIYEVRKR